MVGLYSGHPIKLWVEDMITRAYLQECWNDSQIGFLIAGSNGGVIAAARHAEEDGFNHVFGLIDRDFGMSNRDRWNEPKGPRVFRPEAHELENELLNPAHLAGCALNNQGRSEQDITTRLQKCGSGMLWSISCRSVLSGLRQEVLQDFPPPPTVKSQQQALDQIVKSAWFKHVSATVPSWNQAEITSRLLKGLTSAQTSLNNGQYLIEFPGKELLHDLHSWLYQPPAGSGATAVERDQDLARSIAKFQVANNQVPREIQEMRVALRQRVGI